jgi:hypothetical protein
VIVLAKEYTSTLSSYMPSSAPYSLKISNSGAINPIVPQIVMPLEPSALNYFVKPKSLI